MDDLTMHNQEAQISPIKKYFEYESHDRDDDFEFIAGWAEDREFKTSDDMYLELRQIEQRLGSPSISEDRITKIKNYIKARARLDGAWKEIMSMEKYG